MILRKKVKVKSVEEGAVLYGGATALNNGEIYSYTETASRVVLGKMNKITLYVPAEIEGAEQLAIKYISRNQFFRFMKVGEGAVGGWYSKESGQVQVDRLRLINFFIDADYLDNMILFAKYLCKELNEEAVAFEVNGAYLVIV